MQGEQSFNLKILFYVFKCFAFTFYHMYSLFSLKAEEGTRSPELELQKVVSCHEGAWD